jgi:membrane protein implicated in regulation of membrane protease activity
MTEFLTEYAWILWLALILLFIIVEMLSLELTFLMLGIGSLGGLAAGLLGAPLWLQIIVAALLSVLLLFGLKPPLLRALKRGGDPALSNVDALLGMSGLVLTTVGEFGGHVKLSNGETWTARVSPTVDLPELVEGQRVLVTAIDGATAYVAPAERISNA